MHGETVKFKRDRISLVYKTRKIRFSTLYTTHDKHVFKLMEATVSSKSSVTNYQQIRCHIRGEEKAVETSDYISVIV
jgi:hypothetical protein